MKNEAMNRLLFLIGMSLVFTLIFVLANPSWVGYSGIVYNATENSKYTHNLSANVTGFNNDVTFSFDVAQQNITYTNSSGSYVLQTGDISSWIKIENSSNGNFTINASYNNQTGRYSIPFQARNTTDNTTSGVLFTFDVYPINDVPVFSLTNFLYNLTQDDQFINFTNATDEEIMYPLDFNLTFINNCTHALWSGRNAGENCSILNLTENSNTSAIMNWTSGRDDVGTYWAWINVTDFGSNYPCPHSFCDNSTYKVNKTSRPYLALFNVLADLEVNSSNCNGSLLTEGVAFTCEINISTIGENDFLNVTSYASFANGYLVSPSNRSWFYPNTRTNASNFLRKINVSFTPTKTNVGNWSINISALDLNFSSGDSEVITLFVNWTESAPNLSSIPNYVVYENRTFSVFGYDNDLLIQDKITREERLLFSSNYSWVILLSNTTDNGNNYTNATFKIDYTTARLIEGDANYSVEINVTDLAGNTSSTTFIIQILNDTAPTWNQSSYTFTGNESSNLYVNLSNYLNDTEGDTITFFYSSGNSFPGFSLTTGGEINFTSSDLDVGEHNVTIIAWDGKLNSTAYFNFTIYNTLDAPVIDTLDSSVTVAEENSTEITLNIYDNDFLVTQSGFYSENLSINLTIRNLTVVSRVISFSFNLSTRINNLSIYLANFTPEGLEVGYYNVTINVTDRGNLSDWDYFALNITGVNDPPEIAFFNNQSATILDVFYININATDEEDSPSLPENINLTYSISNLTNGGNFLSINSTSGVINFSLNSSYSGTWIFNVSVNDTLGAIDYQIFQLDVYGYPNITNPDSSYLFNWTEGDFTGIINFTVDYGVNDTLLTGLFYIDKIVFTNATDYYYDNLTNSSNLRNQTNITWTSGSNLSSNFSIAYNDESYGMLKNMTLLVYNPSYPNLNFSLNYKANITYRNSNISFNYSNNISDKGPVTYGVVISINLSNYFTDIDRSDPTKNQTINFSLSSFSEGYVVAASTFYGWILNLSSSAATSENITITAYEYSSNNILIGNVTSNNFSVQFIDPEVVTTPSPSSGGGGGGGGSNSQLLEHYSLKVIAPDDVIISPYNYIDVNFSLQNLGKVDLTGINLSAYVRQQNKFVDFISVRFENDYIPLLKSGEIKSYTLRIWANTEQPNKYKATIWANVSNPSISDWGDFIIELKRTNESETEQILIFIEKLVVENPECIEITEVVRKARSYFKDGNYPKSLESSKEAILACEEAIRANEQIRYPVDYVRDNFYYLAFITAIIFVLGFIYYIYRRVRFNKYRYDNRYEVKNGRSGEKRG